jgi:hypothetical protein
LRRFAEKIAPPKVQKFPAAKQRRLDKLLDKNSEGTITAKEKGALEQLVAQAQQLMVANARRLADFSRGQAGRAPAGAVPVTVWVQSQIRVKVAEKLAEGRD